MSSPVRLSARKLCTLMRSPILNRGLSFTGSRFKDDKTNDTSKTAPDLAVKNKPEESNTASSTNGPDFDTGPVGEEITHLENVWKRSRGEAISEPAEKPARIPRAHFNPNSVQYDVDDKGPKYVAAGSIFWNDEQKKADKERKKVVRQERLRKEEEERLAKEKGEKEARGVEDGERKN